MLTHYMIFESLESVSRFCPQNGRIKMNFVTLNYEKVKLPNAIVMKMSFGDTGVIYIDYIYVNEIYGKAYVV